MPLCTHILGLTPKGYGYYKLNTFYTVGSHWHDKRLQHTLSSTNIKDNARYIFLLMEYRTINTQQYQYNLL